MTALCSMYDEALFGPWVYQMAFRQGERQIRTTDSNGARASDVCERSECRRD